MQIFKRVGLSAVRLLLVPGIVEAFFDGGIAIPIFGMPPTFAFALGFILKAVGPALVIQAMFEVQQKRLGSVKCERPSSRPRPFAICSGSPLRNFMVGYVRRVSPCSKEAACFLCLRS